MEAPAPDPALLLELANARMPFGKYQGRRLIHLPEAYLLWFSREGFPRGKLGEQMQMVYELKQAGLERLLAPLVEGKG
jgi:uncharacterized protein (DUF3820 family)